MRKDKGSGGKRSPEDRCWICGRTAEALDHVRPRAKGGSDVPGNLRPICTVCNSSKGAKWHGEGSLDAVAQEVRDSAWRMKRAELAVIYRGEILGDVLSAAMMLEKQKLESLFDLRDREALRKHVVEMLGGESTLPRRRAAHNPRVMVSRNRSGSFILADDEAQAEKLQQYQQKSREHKKALLRAGILRPEGCERCGTRSAIRTDGGRTPLYAVSRNQDPFSLDVTWICKPCYDDRLRSARRGRKSK